jgi:hypothetical protein
MNAVDAERDSSTNIELRPFRAIDGRRRRDDADAGSVVGVT